MLGPSKKFCRAMLARHDMPRVPRSLSTGRHEARECRAGPARHDPSSSSRADGVGIPMADHLRAMVLRLGYNKAPAYHCELWTHPWFEPHWEVAAILEEYVPFRGVREISKHHDVAHRTTMDAGITEAARRALYVLPTKSMIGWRIPTVGTHLSEQVGKPRPTSLRLQPMKEH
jgi:hypothetical protein